MACDSESHWQQIHLYNQTVHRVINVGGVRVYFLLAYPLEQFSANWPTDEGQWTILNGQPIAPQNTQHIPCVEERVFMCAHTHTHIFTYKHLYREDARTTFLKRMYFADQFPKEQTRRWLVTFQTRKAVAFVARTAAAAATTTTADCCNIIII